MLKRMTLVLAATALAVSGSSLATAATNTTKHKAKSHAISAKASLAEHLTPRPPRPGTSDLRGHHRRDHCPARRSRARSAAADDTVGTAFTGSLTVFSVNGTLKATVTGTGAPQPTARSPIRARASASEAPVPTRARRGRSPSPGAPLPLPRPVLPRRTTSARSTPPAPDILTRRISCAGATGSHEQGAVGRGRTPPHASPPNRPRRRSAGPARAPGAGAAHASGAARRRSSSSTRRTRSASSGRWTISSLIRRGRGRRRRSSRACSRTHRLLDLRAAGAQPGRALVDRRSGHGGERHVAGRSRSGRREPHGRLTGVRVATPTRGRPRGPGRPPAPRARRRSRSCARSPGRAAGSDRSRGCAQAS